MGETRKPARPPSIRFGTSGWRGILGEDVDFESLRRLVRATGRWFSETSPQARVLVGFDTRFASERMADIACGVLGEAGLEPRRSVGVVPTPALSHAIRRGRFAGGLMLTASHNEPEYHGLKVFGPSGASVVDAEAHRIESLLSGRSHFPPAPGRLARRVDLAARYRSDLTDLLDAARLRERRLHVTYDAMHGAGAGILEPVLESLGVSVTAIRTDSDPRFDGGAPDPIPERLGELRERLRTGRGRRIGLATDGDADRFGVVLPGGRVVTETEVIALLVDHMARTGRARRGVAITLGTGSLVERVAADHGLPVARHPVGFKHLSRALIAGAADLAGEESGGFAWSALGYDKDGILAGCLLAEIAASAPKGIAGQLATFERRFGPSACGRVAVPMAPDAGDLLGRLGGALPRRIGGSVVRDVDRSDGLRLHFDDGFVMLRHSGTEPVLRIYAEAPGPDALASRLHAARFWLARARRR